MMRLEFRVYNIIKLINFLNGFSLNESNILKTLHMNSRRTMYITNLCVVCSMIYDDIVVCANIQAHPAFPHFRNLETASWICGNFNGPRRDQCS